MRGWDALALREAGRWTFLVNLIDHLPRTSAYVQAVSEDEELAEEMPSGPGGPRRVALSEWSPDVELQAAIFDRLGDLINTVVATNGGKPQRLDPWPTPVLASHRVQAARRREAAAEMEAKLWPKGDS